jgi:hypothetical protein
MEILKMRLCVYFSGVLIVQTETIVSPEDGAKHDDSGNNAGLLKNKPAGCSSHMQFGSAWRF